MPEKNIYSITVSRHCTGNFIVLAYSATSGIIYKWFKDVFCEGEILKSENEGIDIYAFLDTLAEDVPRGSDGLILLPYFAGKLSPDSNEDARGVFYGMDLGHTKAHFIRAILEGIACMLRENAEIAYDLCGSTNKIISTGGGAKSPVWNQIKADMLNKELCIAQGEGTSLGVAIIAAVCNGWFSSIEEACENVVKISGSFLPDSEGVLEYQKLYDKYLLLYNSLLPVFKI
jgi:xylulokinase